MTGVPKTKLKVEKKMLVMRKPYLIYPVLFLTIFFVTSCQNDENSPPIPGVITHFTDVTSNSMVIHWTRASDADTFQPYLEYKVVTSRTNNLDSLENALANGAVMTYDDPETEEVERIVWNRDITSMLLNYSGFSDGQTYYFSVIVRDAAWRQSAYPMASQKTIDITAPVVGELSIVDETGEALGLEWTAATDNGTNQEDLEYKVVRSSGNNISTVNTAERNGSIVPDWEPDWKTIEDGQLPVMVTSSTTVTEYFNVLVRDSSTDAANVSVYKAVSRKPTPGGAGRVTKDNITATSCTLAWEAATDFGTEQNALQYQVVQSTQSDPVLAWSPNTTAFTVTGLNAETSYSFTVSVKDEDGYIVDYNRVSIRTLDAGSQLQASVNRESMSLPEASFDIADGSDDFFGSVVPDSASVDASLPLQLSGGGHLLVWFDGSDVLGNGSSHEGPVSLWKDKSGMGNHAVQAAVENQPVATAGSLFGDRQAVRFDAGNKNFMAVLLGENLDIIKSAEGYTVFSGGGKQQNISQYL